MMVGSEPHRVFPGIRCDRALLKPYTRLEKTMKKLPSAAIWVICSAIVFVTACAAKTQNGPGGTSGPRDRITAAELAEVDAVDAYTAVQQLRPLWLRARGAASFSEPMGSLPTVYADNMRLGDVGTLQTIPLAEIAEIRYISASDATTRWGTGVVGGVIEVIRKRERTKG
jgi:hypothetical protein